MSHWVPDGGKLYIPLYFFHFFPVVSTVYLFPPTFLPVVDSLSQPGPGLQFSSCCPSAALRSWPWLSLKSDCLKAVFFIQIQIRTGVFYKDYEFKHIPLKQAMNGGQEDILKKRLQTRCYPTSCLWMTKNAFSTIFYKRVL